MGEAPKKSPECETESATGKSQKILFYECRRSEKESRMVLDINNWLMLFNEMGNIGGKSFLF